MALTTTPEFIIFYLDVFSKTLSKKDIEKNIEHFAHEKLKKNPLSTFSAFYFKEGGEPYFTGDLPDIKDFSKNLEENWKKRDQSESNFENGLFFCLSELAAKAAQKAGTYRVIIISDLPSKKNAEYTEALMGLVETIRNFPTFIDIIRVGKEDMYPDEVKLRIITTLTSSGLFYASNSKEFRSVLDGLVKNKKLPDLREEGGQEIDAENKKYYENLANELIPSEPGDTIKCDLCTNDICNFCNDATDIVKKCPQCGYQYHECCAALYSWRHNFGLKHIFRCARCGALIKMDESIVYTINGESIANDPLSEVELEEKYAGEETWNPDEEPTRGNDEEKNLTTPQFKNSAPIEETQSQTIKQTASVPKPNGLFGPRPGFFGGPRPNYSSNNIVDNKSQDEKSSQQEEESKNDSNNGSALARRKSTRRNRARTIMVCPVCSNYVKPHEKKCSKCGSPIL